MYVTSFLLLVFNGSWRPIGWNSKMAISIYTFYTVITSIIFYSFMLSEILDIFLVTENIPEIVENMVQLVNIINVSQKNRTFLFKRQQIIQFMDLFFDDLTKPSTPKEEEIRKKHDGEARSNAMKLYVLYSISVCTVVYLPFFISDTEDRVLAYRGWRPYSLDNVYVYYLTYLHQSLAVTIAAIGNAATETLVSGFMMQICSQFEILEERFMQLPKILNEMRENYETEDNVFQTEKRMVGRLIQQHLRIYQMAKILNETFTYVILFQFVSSISVLVVSTFSLALCDNPKDFIGIFLYLLCMLLQISLYTWYGNEITLRSVGLGNNIFLSDWLSLSPVRMKDLMIIFERTTKPIILSSGYVIALSNTAFTSVSIELTRPTV